MKIGILYNVVDTVERGFDHDKISDNEILETVQLVKQALADRHEVVPVRFRRELISCLSRESFDLIFNLCEGVEGNVAGEAWIPALLDLIGIPYSGSDALTLGLCLDKLKTKYLLVGNDLPTPRFWIFTSPTQPVAELPYPLIVKPVHEDASVGITVDSVVHDESGLRRQLAFVIDNYRQAALVEEYIEGRELNVALVGNGAELEILPISEIQFKVPAEFPQIVSYEAKWLEESPMYQGTVGVCPATLPLDLEAKVCDLARRAYRIVGCRDYARVDFRVRAEQPFILEVNPNPGINSDSGFFRSAKTAGWTYKEFIERLVVATLRRYPPEILAAQKPKSFDWPGERLTLRTPRIEDAPLLLRWFNDPEIGRFMDDPQGEITHDDIIEKFFVAKQVDLDLIATLKETGRDIGYCSLYNIDYANRMAEVSFLVGDRATQGKGLGTEMMQLLIAVGFYHLGLNRLYASVTDLNLPSARVFDRCGFRRVGTMNQYHVLDDRKHDEILFELLREEYQRAKAEAKVN